MIPVITPEGAKALAKLEDYSGAEKFALEKHGDQDHGSIKIVGHLRDVTENIRKHYDPYINNLNVEAVIAAGWLHDTIEDTETSVEDIRWHFGLSVALVVSKVTDGPGKNRKERHLNTYYRIRQCPDATLVKLCDRRHNHARSIENEEAYCSMYLKEFDYFKFALWQPNQFVGLWMELDEQYIHLARVVARQQGLPRVRRRSVADF